MAHNRAAARESSITANPRCREERQINILLLGPTGVGKTTFINAFANYITYDTLDEAVSGQMQVVIPSRFAFTDPETFDEKIVSIGKSDKYEQIKNSEHSSTLRSRSFVFPIGDRLLRLIDTPGIGDTRGIEHDTKNFQDILDYIARFEHLNAVFILLKPNEERLTVLFRYSVIELLRHLDKSIEDNIIFVFTNAGSTFFYPGTTHCLLGTLLKNIREATGIEIPYTAKETFFFDNEGFRFLALLKNGIKLGDEQAQRCMKCWDRSVQEYSRLIAHVMTRPLHALGYALYLNEAEQLVRKLPQPIAETVRLIEDNIQLAKDHKKRVLENPQLASQRIPQKHVVVHNLKYPRTVCTSTTCCRVTGEGINREVQYLSICHERCYLNGVRQETLFDPMLKKCGKMYVDKDHCEACKCLWDKHTHITYECETRATHALPSASQEQRKIEDVYKQLQFLYANSLLMINDSFLEYIEYFIREEEMKQNAGAENTEIVVNLRKLLQNHKQVDRMKEDIEKQKRSGEPIETIKPENVFELVGTLYDLPINGKMIRDQVEGIQINQARFSNQRETFVELPSRAASSKVMLQLKRIVSIY